MSKSNTDTHECLRRYSQNGERFLLSFSSISYGQRMNCHRGPDIFSNNPSVQLIGQKKHNNIPTPYNLRHYSLQHLWRHPSDFALLVLLSVVTCYTIIGGVLQIFALFSSSSPLSLVTPSSASSFGSSQYHSFDFNLFFAWNTSIQ